MKPTSKNEIKYWKKEMCNCKICKRDFWLLLWRDTNITEYEQKIKEEEKNEL